MHAQALPPQVWTSLQDSAGEVLQAMASAVDRAMDHPGLSSTVEASTIASAGPGSTNVTCIAMPVPMSAPLPTQVKEVRVAGRPQLQGCSADAGLHNSHLVFASRQNRVYCCQERAMSFFARVQMPFLARCGGAGTGWILYTHH